MVMEGVMLGAGVHRDRVDGDGPRGCRGSHRGTVAWRALRVSPDAAGDQKRAARVNRPVARILHVVVRGAERAVAVAEEADAGLGDVLDENLLNVSLMPSP